MRSEAQRALPVASTPNAPAASVPRASPSAVIGPYLRHASPLPIGNAAGAVAAEAALRQAMRATVPRKIKQRASKANREAHAAKKRRKMQKG